MKLPWNAGDDIVEEQYKKWVKLRLNLKKSKSVYFRVKYDKGLFEYLNATRYISVARHGDHMLIETPDINRVIKDIADKPCDSVVIDRRTITTLKFRNWVVKECAKYGMLVAWEEGELVKMSGDSVCDMTFDAEDKLWI